MNNGSSGSGGGPQSNGSSGSGGGSQNNGSSGGGGQSQSNSSSGTTSSSGGGTSAASSSGGGSSGPEQDATTGSPGPSGGGGVPTMLPTVTGTCPTIAGANASMLTFAGEPVETWAGSGGGPLVLYWYPTTCNSSCILEEFGQTNIDAVTSMGGVVASFNKSTGTGTNTGDAVWYTGDFATADEVVACAIQELKNRYDPHLRDGRERGSPSDNVDVLCAFRIRRGRGDALRRPGRTDRRPELDAPDASGSEQRPVGDGRARSSRLRRGHHRLRPGERRVGGRHRHEEGLLAGLQHGGRPRQRAAAILPGMWQFMLDHPFKVAKQPYPPIPSVYPSYCQIGPRAADGGAP